MENKTGYSILENVTIYFNGENEVRFRKGIWNFEEATLQLEDLSPNLKEAMLLIVKKLNETKTVDLKEIHKECSLLGEEYSTIKMVFDSLTEQKYIEEENADFTQKFVKEIIGGTVSEFLAVDKIYVKPILFVTDNKRLIDYANMLAEDLEISLTIMSESEMMRIENANLSEKTEAVETITELNELERSIFPYACVVVSIERPRLQFMRNLNRILLDLSIPMVLSILDGPFLTITTVKGNETACYECFENRVLARNEEIAVYGEFFRQTGGMHLRTEKTYMTPILQTFTSFAIFEAFLLASVGRCKLAGRVLNVYLPLIEIQVQDLLRIPYCPACGHVAKAKYDEMYTTSKEVVRNLVDSVVLERSEDRKSREEVTQ